MITGKNYIGNQLSAKGTVTYHTFNPELNQENATVFTEAVPEEIDEAVALATKAFETYSRISGKEKATFLHTIADEILALGDELVDMYCSESGLPQGRAMGERGRTVFQLRSFADLVAEGSWVDATIDTAQPDREPLPKSDIRKMNIPLGPVVVFGASNFPLAFSTAGGDTASALASGCPVIVKSHSMHAGTGELIASAIIKAAEKTRMPNGVFSNITGSGRVVGQALVKHPNIKAVGFTGSISGGRTLFNIASQREEPIPVFAEMGSINPVVILPKSLQTKSEQWAKTYAGSITLGTGQFCTNPGLILGIKSDALTNFVNTLATEISAIDASCMLHPRIAKDFHENKAKAVAQSGLVLAANNEKELKSNYAAQAVATVDGKTFLGNPTLREEVFGPYSIIVQCEDAAELETVIRNLEGQLTGTVISEENEIENHAAVVAALQNRVGRIIFNGVPTGVEVCPSMVHGGPYPASTDSRFTAVGTSAIQRWVRPFSYQDWPNALLPEELKNENPLGILRLVNNQPTKDQC